MAFMYLTWAGDTHRFNMNKLEKENASQDAIDAEINRYRNEFNHWLKHYEDEGLDISMFKYKEVKGKK